VRLTEPQGDDGTRRLDAEALAWSLVIAFGGLGLVLGFALAPAFGEAIQPNPLETWPDDSVRALIAPEPTELARFAIAVVTPVIAAVVLLFAGRRATALRRSRLVRAAPAAVTLVVLGVVAVGWVARSEPQAFGLDPQYFGERDLAIALLVAAAILLVALRRPDASVPARVRTALLRPRTDSRATVLASGAAAVGATAALMLQAVYAAGSLPDAPPITLLHLPFTFADFAAFGNGATPLVDFAGQYSNLLPWLGHPVLAAFDYSPVAFTTLMAVLSALSLLALWRALALTARNEVAGLLLYLPVLALSLRPTMEIADERASNATLVQILPERYLLPCLLAWLCARHLRGLSPRAPLVLFGVAGLALLNNPEFGGPCVAATFFALLVGSPARLSRAAAVRLIGQLAAGVAAAVALVGAATLVRTGSLPSVDLLTYYSRLFGSQGFGLQPMPTLGFHLIVYASFAGSLLLAAFRHRSGATDHALSGLLAYAGCFGLAAGIYYAGRSNAITLVALFPAWGFALALLTWAGFRWLALTNGAWRTALTPIGALAAIAMIGFGLASTALIDAPAPWTQVQRIADDGDGTSSFDLLPEAERFVAEQARAGEPVLILRENGHLLARGAQVRNVSLIGDPVHVVAPAQLDDLLEDLRQAGGRSVFVGSGVFIAIHPGVRGGLRARGYRPAATDRASGLVVWRPRT
jgi:hypothetical protein